MISKIFTKAFVVGSLMALAGSANAGVLYSQAWDGTANVAADQNDTSGALGDFSTTYDDFTLSKAGAIDGVTVVGGYFNPGIKGPITGMEVNFYSAGDGRPGVLIATGDFSSINETFLGDSSADPATGFAMFSYEMDFSPFTLGAGTYWLSVVPDLAFPPEWGVGTSTEGNSNMIQCTGENCDNSGFNMAFTLLDAGGVPEPATWSMMLVGIGGLGAAMRASRRRLAAPARLAAANIWRD
jgi:hypothetical protein